MKRFLILCMVLLLPASAFGFAQPYAVEIITSQTTGANGSVTSAAIDISDYSHIDGYFALAFKIWGSGDADGKFEVLCYDPIAETYTVTAVHTADGDGTTTSRGTIITSSETSFSGTTDSTNIVEFDMPLCSKFKIKVTELDGENESLNVYLIAQ